MQDKLSTEQELRQVIASIGDQLCDTLDNNFDIHIKVDSDDIQGQKLSVLVNFLLEKVRRNIDKFTSLTEQLEDKVRERTETLNLVIEGSNDAVWIWHLQNNTIEFSSHWYELIGGSANTDSVALSAWYARVHPDDIYSLKSAIEEVVKGEQTLLRVEYRIKNHAGQYIWVLCRGACQMDQNGKAQILAGTQTDISELRSLDQLSGLPNESALKEYIHDEIASQSSFFLILVTVNQFESMVETIDRNSLNTLRRQVVKRLLNVTENYSLLARLPGGVFALTGHLNNQDVRHLCAEIEQIFEEPFILKGHNKYFLNTSIGALESSEMTSSNVDEIMNFASAALREGRKSHSICIYDRIIHEKIIRLALVERELRDGIAKQYICAYLQAIVDSESLEIKGFEALARFIHPNLGFVSPAEFIPIAEERGLMQELGDCMLAEAIRMAKSLQMNQLQHQDFYIAVNISARQFEGHGLADKVMRMLTQHQLAPKYLRLEVTESAFMQDMDSAVEQLNDLRSKGIKIALDDFGTGYSSLSYLRRLPIDVLKIDRSFITGLDQQVSKEAIVKTVYGLAQMLSLEVVAEGIETHQELSTLVKVGQMNLQGYLFSMPMPWSKVEAFIETYRHQTKNVCRQQET